MYGLFTKDFIKSNMGITNDVVYFIFYLLLFVPYLFVKLISNTPVVSGVLLAFIRNLSGYAGFFLRAIYYKEKLGYMGKNVLFDIYISIEEPRNINIDDNSSIDAYAKLEVGKGIKIGKYVHICSYVLLQGLGGLIIDDFVGIAAGSKVYTATNHYGKKGESLKSLSYRAPHNMQNVLYGRVLIEAYAFVGINSIILPGVRIGKGAIVGAGSLVKNEIDPYTIVVGTPAKLLKIREDVNDDMKK